MISACYNAGVPFAAARTIEPEVAIALILEVKIASNRVV